MRLAGQVSTLVGVAVVAGLAAALVSSLTLALVSIFDPVHLAPSLNKVIAQATGFTLITIPLSLLGAASLRIVTVMYLPTNVVIGALVWSAISLFFLWEIWRDEPIMVLPATLVSGGLAGWFDAKLSQQWSSES